MDDLRDWKNYGDRSGLKYFNIFMQSPPLNRGISWLIELDDLFVEEFEEEKYY